MFTDTYYLANVILFNEQYFQIKITNNLQRGSMIPETWNIHTVIVTLKHELFVHSDATSGTSLCSIMEETFTSGKYVPLFLISILNMYI